MSAAHSGGSNVGFEKWGPGSQTRPLRFLNMLIRQRSPLMLAFAWHCARENPKFYDNTHTSPSNIGCDACQSRW
jgi:hypothetical protein